MQRSGPYSSVYLVLNGIARILLYVVYLFVYLGEIVSLIVIIPSRFIYQHLRVLYYFFRYVLSLSRNTSRSAIRHIQLYVKNCTNRIQDYFKAINVTIAHNLNRLRFRKSSYTKPFHSTFSWRPHIFYSDNTYVRIVLRVSSIIKRLSSRTIQNVNTILRMIASHIKVIALIPTRLLSKVSYLIKKLDKTIKNKLLALFRKPVRTNVQKVPPSSYTRIKRKYRFLKIGMIVILLGIFSFGTYAVYSFYIELPRPQDIGKVNFALSTHVYDRNGKSLYSFYKDEQRTPVRLSDLPPYIAKATVAIEDKDFYHHNGISIVSGVARAFRDTFIRDQGVQGGSTITQQLVKTALLSPERTLLRKFREAIIALETERVYTKDEILEMYLNQVPYGGSAYGIEEASQKFFGKDAKDINLSEAALLAGLPQAPTTYSPFSNFDAAINRRNQVLHAMREQGYITDKEYILAIGENIDVAQDKISISAPHFVFYVRKQLEDIFDTNELYQGGYRVYTTLDLEIQSKAEVILQEELDKIRDLNVGNGAILVINPLTGEVLAMVGSVNYFDGKSGEYNVTTALRQPGSSIKPIMYSYALERGFTAATIIDDAPTVFQTWGSESYRPVNYDGRFHGKVTVRNALANSYNIPAVKVMNRIGVEDFIAYANHLGIETWQDPSQYGLSIALGGGDVTMLDMAQAFGVLANGGRLQKITSISEILDKKGKTLKQENTEPEQVVDPAYAYIISDILSDNQARVQAFGTNSQLEIPDYKVAVKTGTTDEKRDNWTIGYTPDYLVLVWVGNNDHTPMNPYLTSGVTGAAPIWNRMMTYLLEERNKGSQQWYTKPDNIVQKICFGKMESFVVGTENSVPCHIPRPTPEGVADGNPGGN
jgi:1A family penicillin-binding protein